MHSPNQKFESKSSVNHLKSDSCFWSRFLMVSKSILMNKFFPGWYWGAISASEAHSVLQGASEGTFLIRDSSHPLYMLTLSVKTGRGPTNVRIEYSLGRFRLDSTSPAKSRLQSFPDVPSLVQHYVDSRNKGEEEKTEELDHVTSPAPKECAVLLKLKRPIHRPQAFPSLQHLTRLVINKHTTCTESLPLPRPLLKYLQDYPFQL
uniref:Cytokine-inducible SH2-containing protein n=2 Tax=Sinocyclocheilus grahami TaxID=75366 RepID=A0A672NVL4_SINGR